MTRRARRDASVPHERGAGWQDGWWSKARVCASPNFNARPSGTSIDLVVIHSISLPPGSYGGDFIERLFTNRLDWDAHPYFNKIRGLTVSSHFLVLRDGTLMQFVACDERAWHAGASNWQGRENCNDYSVGVELEGLEGEAFEEEQYHTLNELLHELATRYPIAAVVGHEHVAAGRKHDPGAGFDWQRLRARLGWPAQRFPAALLDPDA